MTDLVWFELHGFCGNKNYVIIPWKRFLIRSLRCCAVYLMLMLCVFDGYYSLVSENAEELKICERISTLFTTEDDKLSVGPRILCKTCYWRIAEFEATGKEVAKFNWEYYTKNFVCWKGEAANGENTCSKHCSSSPGMPGVWSIVQFNTEFRN